MKTPIKKTLICLFGISLAFLFLSIGLLDKKTVQMYQNHEKQDSDDDTFNTELDKTKEYTHRASAIATNLTLEEKVAQLLMVAVSGNSEISPYSVKAFKYVPGAIILYKFNFADKPETVHQFISSCNTAIVAKARTSAQAIPPFFATDNEGGVVFRTASVTSPLPSASTVAKKGTPHIAHELYTAQAEQMAEVGLSMNLAPVCEVGDPDTSVLKTRLFANDSSKVSDFAYECISAMQKTGIACVLKHFPGSGNSDTHYGASSIDLDYKLFCDSCEVFRKPLSQSLAVMASHVIVPCLDTVPFCISHKGISFLRNHFNYSGVVMSDDIIMKALEPYCKNYVDLACQAISAGCDLILYSASDFTNLIQGIADRARQDSRLSERIDEAVHSILIAKLKIGLLADENATVKNSEFVKSHFIDAYNQGLSVYEIFKE